MRSLIDAARGAVEVQSLKMKLRLGPANTELRAKLGALQYKTPATPVGDLTRALVPVSIAEVTIEVRNPCNYRCFYCVAAGLNNVPVKHFDLPAIEKSLKLIKAELIVFSLECEGGEPTVHPQFPELIRLLASFGPVSFPTNNSQKPERWLPREFAKRLYIRSAIHPETEEKLERYSANALHLIEAGCDFSSIFIAHPDRIPKIPQYREHFQAQGIPFTPVAFIGEIDGKSYPNSYTVGERELIGLNEENRTWQHKLEPHATRIRNFRGIPCIAGHSNLFIGRDGSTRRCIYDARKIDGPSDKPEPCAVKTCGCGLMLEKLNSTGSIDFYNSWAPKAGLPSVDVSDFKNLHEDLFQEGVAVYDELMRAYAKDEIPEQT